MLYPLSYEGGTQNTSAAVRGVPNRLGLRYDPSPGGEGRAAAEIVGSGGGIIDNRPLSAPARNP
jgi:hypothetical protein